MPAERWGRPLQQDVKLGFSDLSEKTGGVCQVTIPKIAERDHDLLCGLL